MAEAAGLEEEDDEENDDENEDDNDEAQEEEDKEGMPARSVMSLLSECPSCSHSFRAGRAEKISREKGR